MAQGLVEESTMSGLASAFRAANERFHTSTWKPSEMISMVVYPLSSIKGIVEGTCGRLLDIYWSEYTSDGSVSQIKAIKQRAFYLDSTIFTVRLDSVISIHSYAFYSCSRLQYALFSNCLSVGSYAFYSCGYLSNCNFSNVQYIYNAAFYSCRNITTLTFNQLSIIYPSAFRYCSTLSSLYLLGSSVCTLSNANAFQNTPISTSTNAKIYVPSSLYATYIASTNWVSYSSRFVSM